MSCEVRETAGKESGQPEPVLLVSHAWMLKHLIWVHASYYAEMWESPHGAAWSKGLHTPDRLLGLGSSSGASPCYTHRSKQK